MTGDATDCLYVSFDAPFERHDALVRDVFGPLAGSVRGAPGLHALFFVRFNVPRWHLRVRVLGDGPWLEADVRPALERIAREGARLDGVASCDWRPYEPEYERYGGMRGVRLAERIFTADSLACLELLDAEDAGQGPRSRREYALVMIERVLDLCGIHGPDRSAFHASGYRWAVESGSWEAPQIALLEERYGALREGIARLVGAAAAGHGAAAWGSGRVAAAAERCLDALAPTIDAVRRGLAEGSVTGTLPALAWSWTHMSCNRLGVEPAGEAILHFMMHRWWDENAG